MVGGPVALTLALTALPPTAAEVTVTLAPPTSVIRTFDPTRPPEELPQRRGDEVAATRSRFGCRTDLQVDVVQVGRRPPVATLSAVHITLTLDNTIWLPASLNRRIYEHEEDHQRISEAFHTRGQGLVRLLAARHTDRVGPLPAGDEGDAVVQRIGRDICRDYLQATEGPAEVAQRAFDRLTDHGRDPLPSATAIARALAEATAP